MHITSNCAHGSCLPLRKKVGADAPHQGVLLTHDVRSSNAHACTVIRVVCLSGRSERLASLCPTARRSRLRRNCLANHYRYREEYSRSVIPGNTPKQCRLQSKRLVSPRNSPRCWRISINVGKNPPARLAQLAWLALAAGPQTTSLDFDGCNSCQGCHHYVCALKDDDSRIFQTSAGT